MVRVSFPAVRAAFLLIGGMASLHFAAAADRDSDRRVTNSFVLMTAAPPPTSAAPRPSPNGVGVPPAKPVVSNPYQVPLLQNAGTLRGR